MRTRLEEFILGNHGLLGMPIGVNAGLEATGQTTRQAVSDPEAQAHAALALHERFHTPILLTAMDLSAEAEAFGCEIHMPENEVPNVIGRKVTTLDGINDLAVPPVGDGRTWVHLRSAELLLGANSDTPVLGGMIGPFSLAGRLFGVSEALEATMLEPDWMLALLEKVTAFLTEYALAFRMAGGWGVIMAEPAAGLLSPRALERFSSVYVRRIVEAVQNDRFAVVLHNCGAKLVHLPKILEAKAAMYHFGAPMDLPGAFAQVGDGAILAGNLDPSGVFLNGTPELVYDRARSLAQTIGRRTNFVVSSGCDLPPGVSLKNLEAFFKAIQDFNAS